LGGELPAQAAEVVGDKVGKRKKDLKKPATGKKVCHDKKKQSRTGKALTQQRTERRSQHGRKQAYHVKKRAERCSRQNGGRKFEKGENPIGKVGNEDNSQKKGWKKEDVKHEFRLKKIAQQPSHA